MTDDAFMLELLSGFRQYLESRDDFETLFECFRNQGVRLEGWLKGEFLHYLTKAKENYKGRVFNFDREARFGRGKRRIDIKVAYPDPVGPCSKVVWIELKHWLIGYQKGDRRDAGHYFGIAGSSGIKPDVEKLQSVHGGKYIVVLSTSKPTNWEWQAGIKKFNSTFQPLSLNSLTNPDDFPHYYFLGLLSTERTSNSLSQEHIHMTLTEVIQTQMSIPFDTHIEGPRLRPVSKTISQSTRQLRLDLKWYQS